MRGQKQSGLLIPESFSQGISYYGEAWYDLGAVREVAIFQGTYVQTFIVLNMTVDIDIYPALVTFCTCSEQLQPKNTKTKSVN